LSVRIRARKRRMQAKCRRQAPRSPIQRLRSTVRRLSTRLLRPIIRSHVAPPRQSMFTIYHFYPKYNQKYPNQSDRVDDRAAAVDPDMTGERPLLSADAIGYNSKAESRP
jgi:hypothetical protein